jgi:hypothetical protein
MRFSTEIARLSTTVLRVYSLHFTLLSRWLAVNITNQSHREAPLIGEQASPNVMEFPRDAQRADKKEIAGRRRKERPLMGKECVIFPEGGLSLV